MWYDSEVYGGNKKSNVAAQDIFYGPNNKKNDPCATCPLAATCMHECKAFTAWCDTGDFNEAAVGVFKKNAKKVAQGVDKYELICYYEQNQKYEINPRFPCGDGVLLVRYRERLIKVGWLTVKFHDDGVKMC